MTSTLSVRRYAREAEQDYPISKARDLIAPTCSEAEDMHPTLDAVPNAAGAKPFPAKRGGVLRARDSRRAREKKQRIGVVWLWLFLSRGALLDSSP